MDIRVDDDIRVLQDLLRTVCEDDLGALARELLVERDVIYAREGVLDFAEGLVDLLLGEDIGVGIDALAVQLSMRWLPTSSEG